MGQGLMALESGDLSVKKGEKWGKKRYFYNEYGHRINEPHIGIHNKGGNPTRNQMEGDLF